VKYVTPEIQVITKINVTVKLHVRIKSKMALLINPVRAACILSNIHVVGRKGDPGVSSDFK
jgi:hypothetical protein